MISHGFILTAVSLLAIVSVAALPAAAAPPGYKLVWSDEFNGKVGTPPDPKSWTHEMGASGWGNQELENYVDDVEHSHIVADRKATGKRALQILATTDGHGSYRSARLKTAGKQSFQYGYIEARIKLAYGQGIWPAFWMLGEDIGSVGWPSCGEIDIMENIGRTAWWGQNRSSLHGPGYSGGNSLHGDYNLPNGKYFKDGYHTFGMLWSADSITFSVDGVPFETRTSNDIPGKRWAFNHPFFFILNVAVGGNLPQSPDATTLFPQKMLIDYVRVYQLKTSSTA